MATQLQLRPRAVPHPDLGSRNPELIAVIKDNHDLFNRNEKLANAFASALLLPAEPIREELRKAVAGGGLTYASLVAIAGDFRVSTQALLWRLVNMGVYRRDLVQALLGDPQLNALDAASKQGRGGDPPPLPRRFVHLCYLAWQQAHLSRSRLAEYLETNLADLDDCLADCIDSSDIGEGIDLSSIANANCFSLEDEEWPVIVPSA